MTSRLPAQLKGNLTAGVEFHTILYGKDPQESLSDVSPAFVAGKVTENWNLIELNTAGTDTWILGNMCVGVRGLVKETIRASVSLLDFEEESSQSGWARGLGVK